jgi:23S rRNA pseudouridine1911/1915/1917 synthase
MHHMGRERQVVADRGDAGQRLDLVVRRHLADLTGATRTRVQSWILDGAVTVNGQAMRRPAARVAGGDRIGVTLPAGLADRRPMVAEDRPLVVLYEDDHLIAVDKPAGVVVHPTYNHFEGTILNALLGRAARAGSERPSIVGRLDKLTSGIVVAAKTPRAHAALQRALASGRADKQYLAIVYGRAPQRGTIELRLRRDPRDRRKVIASPEHGSPSATRFERVAHALAPPVGLTLLRCHLVTGRMHQIRVHLASRGWPIVGDAKYGQPRWQDMDASDLQRELSSLERQALHASRLVLTHPITAQPLTIDAPLPADLSRLLAAAGLVQCAR